MKNLTAINSNHENYLNLIIWLNTPFGHIAHNLDKAHRVMEAIERLEDRSITMDVVEKAFFHYVSNNFGGTPYPDFDPSVFQNAHQEETGFFEEMKYILCYATNRNTCYFNNEVQEKMKDFDIKLDLIS